MSVQPIYAVKIEAEQVLLRITSETGMEVVIIRPPLVYGTGNPGNFYNSSMLLLRGGLYRLLPLRIFEASFLLRILLMPL